MFRLHIVIFLCSVVFFSGECLRKFNILAVNLLLKVISKASLTV